ncbi:hypothetical protein QQ045_008520 [Rhodiola kirilowii]
METLENRNLQSTRPHQSPCQKNIKLDYAVFESKNFTYSEPKMNLRYNIYWTTCSIRSTLPWISSDTATCVSKWPKSDGLTAAITTKSATMSSTPPPKTETLSNASPPSLQSALQQDQTSSFRAQSEIGDYTTLKSQAFTKSSLTKRCRKQS